jgi:phage terminase small subunit
VTKANSKKKFKQPNQDAFIQNYILNGCKNAKQAAIDAGYSEKTAEQSASRLLRSVKAQEAIEKYKKTQLETYVWSKADKLKKLEQIVENATQKDDDQKMINHSAAIAAIKTHNEMQGDNAPIETNQKVQVTNTLKSRLTGGSRR